MSRLSSETHLTYSEFTSDNPPEPGKRPYPRCERCRARHMFDPRGCPGEFSPKGNPLPQEYADFPHDPNTGAPYPRTGGATAPVPTSIPGRPAPRPGPAMPPRPGQSVPPPRPVPVPAAVFPHPIPPEVDDDPEPIEGDPAALFGDAPPADPPGARERAAAEVDARIRLTLALLVAAGRAADHVDRGVQLADTWGDGPILTPAAADALAALRTAIEAAFNAAGALVRQLDSGDPKVSE